MRYPGLLIMLFLCLPGLTLALEPDREELEKWLESDEDVPPSVSTDRVNEGELVFLQKPPAREVHHHQTRLIIDHTSLQNGWVRLKQCHDHLDRVPRAQILYNRERVRDLAITVSRNIGQSWVENNSVQLSDIGENARLCVIARTRVLQANGDGSYSMHNGPFMRRFLDGYYPMRVSMDIDYSDSGLRLVAMTPHEQQGFRVSKRKGHLLFDAWFEGKLRTEFRFRPDAL